MTKAETIQIATLIQQVKDIKEDTAQIIKHQEGQESKILDTIRATEAAKVIAKAAKEKADEVCTSIEDYKKSNDKKVNNMYLFAAFLIGAGVLSGLGISSLMGG